MSITRHESRGILSNAVEANGMVYLSGVVPQDLSGGIKEQTKSTLDEIDRLLKVCGTDKSKVVHALIWVPDIKLRGEMNEIWNEWTGGNNLPARACVESKLADPKILVEIMVTAVK